MRGLDHTNFRISIDTKKLEGILTDNRKIHLSDFKIARKAYEEKAIEALQRRIEKFKGEKHKKADMSFHMEAPRNYVKAYDEALDMLGHHTEKNFELNSEAYRSLVEDKWSWASGFYSNALTYSTDLVGSAKFDSD